VTGFRPTAGGRGLAGAALSAAGSWLLEPADPEPVTPTRIAGPRPVIAVFGLAPGCGTTMVARALAAELATRDPAGAAAVSCELPGSGMAVATQAAMRLARSLADVPGAAPRALGRLCLVSGADPLALADCSRHFAPLLLDAGSAALGGRPAALADHTIIVAAAAAEPALVPVAAACLGRVGPEPVVILNGPDRGRWSGRATLTLPRSRMGAQLALGGREPRGELGRAVARLADLVGGG
jgi:hypothetical protein